MGLFEKLIDGIEDGFCTIQDFFTDIQDHFEEKRKEKFEAELKRLDERKRQIEGYRSSVIRSLDIETDICKKCRKLIPKINLFYMTVNDEDRRNLIFSTTDAAAYYQQKINERVSRLEFIANVSIQFEYPVFFLGVDCSMLDEYKYIELEKECFEYIEEFVEAKPFPICGECVEAFSKTVYARAESFKQRVNDFSSFPSTYKGRIATFGEERKISVNPEYESKQEALENLKLKAIRLGFNTIKNARFFSQENYIDNYVYNLWGYGGIACNRKVADGSRRR